MLADVLGPPGLSSSLPPGRGRSPTFPLAEITRGGDPFSGLPGTSLHRPSSDTSTTTSSTRISSDSGALQKEPSGAASLEGLKKRPSRRLMLDEVLGKYAVFGPVELRETLATLLRSAATRLGPPDEESNLGDPTFMVVHALNLIDPNNWHEVSVTLPDGTQGTAYQYVSPEAESRHLSSLQEASQDKFTDTNMQTALGLALEDPSRSSPELAAAAVEWARGAMAVPKNGGKEEDWMREEAIITAAMIAMRDGDAELRARHEAWARAVFAQALQTKKDSVHRFRSGLRFNPIAIAFVGIIHLLKDHPTTGDVRTLLEVAASRQPGRGARVRRSGHHACLHRRTLAARGACGAPSRHVFGRVANGILPEDEVAMRSERYRQRVRSGR